jgi:hypothetical protein
MTTPTRRIWASCSPTGARAADSWEAKLRLNLEYVVSAL